MTELDMENARRCLELLLVGTFCAFTVHFTLRQKGHDKKCASKWAVVIFAAAFILLIANLGMDAFVRYVDKVMPYDALLENPLMDTAISTVYVVFNMVVLLFR